MAENAGIGTFCVQVINLEVLIVSFSFRQIMQEFWNNSYIFFSLNYLAVLQKNNNKKKKWKIENKSYKPL